MPYDETLRAAAVQSGIQQDFWDIFGRQHLTAEETNRAILEAQGFDCSSEEAIVRSLDERTGEELSRALPPVLVVAEGSNISLPVTTPEAVESLRIEVAAEDGALAYTNNVELAALKVLRKTEWGGGRYVVRELELPVKLAAGYHMVKAGENTMRLVVAPERARLPNAAGKYAGLGVMLYGIRSARNWGCGDFRDLRDLIDWAAPALSISFLALNPLHAIHNRRPFNTSPYLPTSVFWRNFLYLDVESVAGYERIRPRFETAEVKAAWERLRGSDVVVYEEVAELKRRALDLIFEAAQPAPEALRWIEGEGDLLRLYATWCALDEHFHAADPNVWSWTEWPEEYRDPSSAAVAGFAAANKEKILFHSWVQWLIDDQIGAVQRRALELGMPIGLYHDLALATDRCGADLWAFRSFYIRGCRVGAPPDDFSPTGQDWSFPPPNSRHHRQDGYRLYIESIRKAVRHGGALRIDHVMSLFRLYWIPAGHDAAHGAYVRQPAGDLVKILVLESVRNQAVIVGEDLGTVEPDVRATLAAAGILSYRLLYFERKGEAFKLPSEYPKQALAASTTHDLATIEGFWCGEDIEARRRSGTIDQAAFEAQKAARNRDKQALLEALFTAGVLAPGYERNAGAIPQLTPELHYAIVGFLASTASILWLVNQEDMTRELNQQNLPGTTDQYPNWSRKMRWSLDDLVQLREASDCAAMVRGWIERSGRSLAAT